MKSALVLAVVLLGFLSLTEGTTIIDRKIQKRNASIADAYVAGPGGDESNDDIAAAYVAGPGGATGDDDIAAAYVGGPGEGEGSTDVAEAYEGDDGEGEGDNDVAEMEPAMNHMRYPIFNGGGLNVVVNQRVDAKQTP